MRKNVAKLLKRGKKHSRVFIKSRKDKFLSSLSLSALGLSIGMLVLVLCSIVNNGYKALTTTRILLPLEKITQTVASAEGMELRKNCITYIRQSLKNLLVDTVDLSDPKVSRIAYGIVSETAHYDLATLIKRSKTFPLTQQELWVNVSSEFATGSQSDDKVYRAIAQKLKNEGRIKKFFNSYLFTHSNSKVAENAGIVGAFIGSLLTIAVCMAIALPLGIMSGICLQELMLKNKVSSLIEVSINNLSSVPSIIFGVLGLVVYLNIFDVPRSSALVGGMTLSLMILPSLIITTREALATVPESVKHAAFSLGASDIQVAMHHSFPIALPAIVQGVVVSVARIIGESSPLIMIGMVAFIVDVPKTFLDPTSVLPVQIYIWANNSSVEFTKIAAIAIISLLFILLILNVIASFIRRRFDHFSF